MPIPAPLRLVTTAAALIALCVLPGCMAMIAGSGELDDESVQRTQTKDQEERMKRMREGGTVRPAEYNALNERMGAGDGGQVAPKPTVEELERRVQQNKRRREEAAQ